MQSSRSALGSLYATTREQLNAYATDVNTTATQVAQLNQAITVANQSGQPSNELADQRDLMVMHLSVLTGATATTRDNGSVDVSLGGSGLVNGASARQVTVIGASRLDQVATDPVALQWTDSGAMVGTDSGQVASMLKTLNTTLPSYTSGVDTVAAALADTINAQHAAGYDLTGAPGGALFVSSDGQPLTAANITVGITDPILVAAASTSNGSGGGTLDGGNADTLANLATTTGSADKVYRQLVVSLGVDAQAADRRAGIQNSLTDDVDSARQGQSGVNLDEEMTNLMAFQRAYQAASKVINTIDSCLDTLINHTGS
jgi:flagellar hook-associated protein 1 FlgK